MFEEDFRTSVEISVIFQICIIIATLEETYKITMLRDHFELEQPQEKKEQIFFDNIDNNKNSLKLMSKEGINHIENENYFYNYTNNNKFNYNIISETDDKNSSVINDLKDSNINFILPHPNDNNFQNIANYYNNKMNDINQYNTPYNNIKQNYQKNKNKKDHEEKISKVENNKAKKLGEENINLNSKFSKAVYRFLDSLVLFVSFLSFSFFSFFFFFKF